MPSCGTASTASGAAGQNVTPGAVRSARDEEPQLRAAVVADTDWLDLLNQQTTAGQLKGFALEASAAWYLSPAGVNLSDMRDMLTKSLNEGMP